MWEMGVPGTAGQPAALTSIWRGQPFHSVYCHLWVCKPRVATSPIVFLGQLIISF